MALLEEAIRFAESLDDYDHVSAADIGGTDPTDYWLVVRDHRFELDYELPSHCDYWEFVTAFVRSLRAANSGGGSAVRFVRARIFGGETLIFCRQGRSSRRENDRRRISGRWRDVAGTGKRPADIRLAGCLGPVR